MTPKQRAIRVKVPPRRLFVIVYACGAICSCRTRGEAELIRATHKCACLDAVKCGARIIPYNRGYLYGKGAATWPRQGDGGR